MSPGSKRRSDPDPEDDLLDLPFDPPPAEAERPAEAPPHTVAPAPSNLDLFDAAAAPAEASGSAAATQVGTSVATAVPMHEVMAGAQEAVDDLAGSEPAPLAQRARAGVTDVVVHASVLVLTLLVLRLLGVVVSIEGWPGFLGFLVSFSFLYVTIPLAFWGQTPGMGWAGIKCYDRDGRPLSFSQCVLRWAVAVATVGLLGLPSLFRIEGSSLADVASRSVTVAT